MTCFFWREDSHLLKQNRLNNHANRGKTLEDLIISSNQLYREKKIALIHKVPTEWLPIRDRSGKIMSAKVDKKSAVDFLGHINSPKAIIPLSFDAKEVARGDRWPLPKLEDHQYEYLKDSAETGAFSFLLIAYWELQKFFVLPFPELEKRWQAWKTKTGPASVKAGENGLIEVRFMRYLDFLPRGD
ncbi:MAG: recombinase [Dehalococcoidia bacterium]|nr:MAG: recombinase [Dehalococcoidia bacterium]